jgi:hypothetical protein
MSIRQVRTKSNRFNRVKYDGDGNILTPARKKELKGLPKKSIKGPKWIKIISQYNGTCFVCSSGIKAGTEILWNKNNKKTRHVGCIKSSNRCKAVTKKNKLCPIPVESWRESGLCHVHDPEGNFRRKKAKKGHKNNTKIAECQHTWYMRENGITCTKCLIVDN